ncbi:XTP/dITP diphosphatase [Clostridiaceae bacterium HSG29]|nr:XTP/dITP diphosphatase [Clostridiaceae bacterium HSG29]
MKKYVLASGNKHKLEEINKIVEKFDIELVMMSDVGLQDLEIIEDGDTFEENSYIKAKTVCDLTNIPTIADDSGLMVDYLDGAPGVYSARYSGTNATYESNNVKLISALEGVESSERGAKFVTVITVVFPNEDKIVARGEIDGIIGTELKGENGFGYDPLFNVKEHNLSFAEMGSDLKNEISHRARALKELKKKLEKYYGEINENINN